MAICIPAVGKSYDCVKAAISDSDTLWPSNWSAQIAFPLNPDSSRGGVWARDYEEACTTHDRSMTGRKDVRFTDINFIATYNIFEEYLHL